MGGGVQEAGAAVSRRSLSAMHMQAGLTCKESEHQSGYKGIDGGKAREATRVLVLVPDLIIISIRSLTDPYRTAQGFTAEHTAVTRIH